MAQSLTTMLRDGRSYMDTWPMQKELYPLFPECRVIAATRLGIKVMPPLAILVAIVHYTVLGQDNLPQSIALAAFFLSMPLQGLLWLGHRSNQMLPPGLVAWYKDLHQKMRLHGCQVQMVKARPRYKELAGLLKTAFSELDRVFTKQWF
ncbi:terminus macrodomain insulation protein YfbV [Aliiglaciecola sp. CAU 1673]|uniref:terminus macrodomain insulation protein YfbV n=1 Tax=Aliiglaciecola sp. CAU 1673 TaxID=3032595 RepID=UPI0023DA17D4|nr:terminus macrodomain insulation protein YfbV [Aliiglaciecola sp. CAU 1673]MDF2177707.1 terminus macrodomain insulation protein YfbV [Aliiglaciecola sp. CAU 1673]